MNCQFCGKTMGLGAVYCSSCGQPSTNSQAALQQSKVAVTTYQPVVANGWGGGTMILLAILAVVLPIAGLIAGIVGLTKPVTRAQGSAILFFSIIGWIINILILSSM